MRELSSFTGEAAVLLQTQSLSLFLDLPMCPINETCIGCRLWVSVSFPAAATLSALPLFHHGLSCTSLTRTLQKEAGWLSHFPRLCSSSLLFSLAPLEPTGSAKVLGPNSPQPK